MHSWRVLLLPYCDNKDLYDQYDFSQPWNSSANAALADQMPSIYTFHGTPTDSGITNYLAVVGENTFWPGARGRQQDEITDDPASTIMLVENQGAGINWMEPRDLELATMSFELNQPTGIGSSYEVPAVLLADFTLRKLSDGISPPVLQGMLTVNAGESIAAEGESWQLLEDGRLREPAKLP